MVACCDLVHASVSVFFIVCLHVRMQLDGLVLLANEVHLCVIIHGCASVQVCVPGC